MKPATALLLSIFAAHVVYAAPITPAELKEKSEAGLHLLQFAEDQEPEWKTDEEELELLKNGVNFFDLTYVYKPDAAPDEKKMKVAVEYPDPSHQADVNPILETVSLGNMQGYLSELTSFNNRYYQSSTGVEATEWIVSTIQSIANQFTHVEATVAPFTHSWPQSSIIARIPGTSEGPVTILGSHMDSINLSNPRNGRAPGADDDGSGSVNLIEAFRALMEAGFTPSTPVEFHWYAGEEAGLLGSQAIANQYSSNGVEVKAMMQLDMTAYFQGEETIALMPDFVDEGLTAFTEKLIDTYLTIPWETNSACGYACSDHASWNRKGYPTVMPFETRFGEDNPVIHTSSDTVNAEGFSWEHSLQYAKLAVAFAYELGA